MTQEQLKNRADVPEALTWDVTALYKTRADFETALNGLKAATAAFATTYEGKLTDAKTILAAMKEYERLIETATLADHYAMMPEATDLTDPDNVELSRQTANAMADISAQLTFFESELIGCDVAILDQVVSEEARFASYIRHIKKNKSIQLAPEVEKALAQLAPTLDAPSAIYEQARLGDMDFGTFTADGKEYPLSFVLYEDYYMYHDDTAIRRAAFDKFSAVLSDYENVVATAYYTQLQKEKTLATMRGFDSVIDYLLYGQEVTRDLYDRQIDTIMNDLAPVMQKYITHLKEIRGLDKMTYADLKIALDPEYSPQVSIEESQVMVEDAIAVLGKDYTDRIMQAYSERWIDFAQNIGKSTGGFCTSPYGTHPYILMSWANQLSDVYTLIHELGHAGQMILSNENNSILGSEPSLYLIEGPSTFNELLLTESLARKSTDARMQRFALTKMLSDTYFHNFVTHLLEAAYQREVYNLIDAGKSFDAGKLSEIKRSVLERFWGDAVEINAGAELTWMRQIHYYMGLYSYTYSAGLTIATQAFLRVKAEEEGAVADWLEFLALGDKLEAAEAAALAGVDIKTDQALQDTIHYLDEAVDHIITLSKELA